MTNSFAGHLTSFLTAAAKQRRARIVLPESEDARILSAAARAHADGIAQCILFGQTEAVHARAEELQIPLPDSLSIVQPPVDSLAGSLTKLRAHKGMTYEQAVEILRRDSVYAATVFVHENSADGMLAGAVTASAAVLRPVLQIIGKTKGAPLASSFFLMDMPDAPLLFADCALNIRPSSEELAAIAEQSATSARRFGMSPKVAMLSHATGESAGGCDVQRVKAAAELAQQQMPDIPVMGPIQYDAAISPQIGAAKAPQWREAGHANVLIFPDISAGNIAYKAVQQSANINAIGPLMQGIAAPANDLSRGATEEDIYLAIAATSAQCKE